VRGEADPPPRRRSLARLVFRRGPWETLATALIAAGVVMLMQPFSITLFGYSFVTTLTGVVLYTIVTKFPD
jgi:uncharacterized membrane protein YjjP (DUF1212 family)